MKDGKLLKKGLLQYFPSTFNSHNLDSEILWADTLEYLGYKVAVSELQVVDPTTEIRDAAFELFGED